jgi:hypothetical protein
MKGFLKLVSVFKEASKNLAFEFLSNKDKKNLKTSRNHLAFAKRGGANKPPPPLSKRVKHFNLFYFFKGIV